MKGDTTKFLLQFQGKFYACASIKAVNEFSRSPSRHIDDVISVAKTNPELIFLLDLQSYFPPVPTLPSPLALRTKRASMASLPVSRRAGFESGRSSYLSYSRDF